MLAVAYIPEKTISQETGTVGELPVQGIVVHDAECLAERIERTVDKVYLKEGIGIEHDIPTYVEEGMGEWANHFIEASKFLVISKDNKGSRSQRCTRAHGSDHQDIANDFTRTLESRRYKEFGRSRGEKGTVQCNRSTFCRESSVYRDLRSTFDSGVRVVTKTVGSKCRCRVPTF